MLNVINQMIKTINAIDNGEDPKIANAAFDENLKEFRNNVDAGILAGKMFLEICLVQQRLHNYPLSCLAMYVLAKPYTKDYIVAKYPEVAKVISDMRDASHKVLSSAKSVSLASNARKAFNLQLQNAVNNFYKGEIRVMVEDAKRGFENQAADRFKNSDKNNVKEKMLINIVGAASAWLTSNKENHFVVIPFCLPPTDLKRAKQYLENEFIKTIYSICLFLPDFTIDLFNKEEISAIELDKEIKQINSDKYYTCFINLCGDYMAVDIESYKVKDSLIFWGLVMAAVDERFYENEMNMISDMAYQFNFTEDMINDWIKAVKYLLDGNMFSGDMPVEFKTAEANKFFKHK